MFKFIFDLATEPLGVKQRIVNGANGTVLSVLLSP